MPERAANHAVLRESLISPPGRLAIQSFIIPLGIYVPGIAARKFQTSNATDAHSVTRRKAKLELATGTGWISHVHIDISHQDIVLFSSEYCV